MTYDPNVFGYVDGQPTYSRDEFIYKKRRRGPITDDAELVAFAEKVTSGWYNATEEAVERVAEAASSMKLSPEAVQRILDAFDNIIEAINRMIEWAAQAIRTLADFFGETLDNFILRRAPPKWRHYALHAKRARVRKKYRNRIRRAFFAALASEGGGSS